MNHPDEQTIERVAMALIELGFSMESDAEPRVPLSLAPSLEHIWRCAHCRETLEILIETERAWRRSEKSSGKVLLPLRPLRVGPPARGDDPAPAEDADEFLVAAADASTRPAQTRVLTLVTEDDRFLVRIFPDEEGGGATAILVSLPESDADAAGAIRPILRLEGTDYGFDESRTVRLPHFPTSEIALFLGGAS